MNAFVLTVAFGLLTLAILLALVRLARGPTVIDRILAFDLVATCGVGMMVLMSIRWKTALYLELILVFSLLGFIGTVALVHYLSRTRDVGRPAPGETPSRPSLDPPPGHD